MKSGVLKSLFQNTTFPFYFAWRLVLLVIPLNAIFGHEETRSPCGRGYFFFGWRLRR